MADDLSTTMDALISCLCDALETADRAVCSCGLTIGPPEPGPAGCCDCDSGTAGGQVTGFLERVYPADKTRAGIVSAERLENCNSGGVAADITLVVLRCYPSMDDQGNMPTLDETTPFAHSMNDDLVVAWNALKCCGTDIVIRDSGVDVDTDGGCSAFAIRVSVMVSMAPEVVDVS